MSLDYKSIAGNIVVAFLAQGFAFFSSAVTSLLVPKVLGIEDFGYWQLFLFYSGYVGICHFGLNDGIYLVNGGKTRSELDLVSLVSQLRMGAVVQLVLACLVIVGACFLAPGPERVIVIAATSYYMVVSNAASFLEFLLQATNETKRYSLSVIVDKASFLAPLAILLVLRVDVFMWYVAAFCFGRTCSLAYCCIRNRDVMKAKGLPFAKAVLECRDSVVIGVKLLVANVAATFILGVMRLEIDACWGIEAFSVVSFALTITGFFLSMTSNVAMVLFPALRRVPEEDQRAFFENSRDLLGLFLPMAYVLYYPMCLVLEAWLPQYAVSLAYFALLLPLCVFDGKMNMVSTTFLNVRREEGLLLRINVVSVAASAAVTTLGVFGLGDIDITICLVMFVVAVRSMVSECILMHRMGGAGYRVLVGEAAMTIVFVASAAALDGFVSFVITLVVYCMYLLVNRRRLAALLRKVRNMR